ncbi:hypothetical protein GCAAIG_00640 [Candidatus Electronema halotolerans]
MILNEHVVWHERAVNFFPSHGDMCMLGNQENRSNFNFGRKIISIDPDGGDFKIDLSDPRIFVVNPDIHRRFSVVYNLGTIEHIWDIHTAYVNASELCDMGGVFVNIVPVSGYALHGMHVTNHKYIEIFFLKNGYDILDIFYTSKEGESYEAPTRWFTGDILQWIVARKCKFVESYIRPQEIFVGGRRVEV